MKSGTIAYLALALKSWTQMTIVAAALLMSCSGKNPNDKSLMGLTMQISNLSEPQELRLPFEAHWSNAKKEAEVIIQAMQKFAKAQSKDSGATLKESEILDLHARGYLVLDEIARYLTGAKEYFGEHFRKADLVKKAYLTADLIRILYYRSLLLYADELDHLKKNASPTQLIDLHTKLRHVTQSVAERLESAFYAIGLVSGPWQEEYNNQVRRSVEDQILAELQTRGLRAIIDQTFTQQAVHRVAITREENQRVASERRRIEEREARIARLEKFLGKSLSPEEKITYRSMPDDELKSLIKREQKDYQRRSIKEIHLSYLLSQSNPPGTREELEKKSITELAKLTKAMEERNGVDQKEKVKHLNRINLRSYYFDFQSDDYSYNEFEFDGVIYKENSTELSDLPLTHLVSLRNKIEAAYERRKNHIPLVDEIRYMEGVLNYEGYDMEQMYEMSLPDLKKLAAERYREMRAVLAQNGQPVPFLPLIAEARSLSGEKCNDKIVSDVRNHYKKMTVQDLNDFYQALEVSPASRYPSITTRAYLARRIAEDYLKFRLLVSEKPSDFPVQEFVLIIDRYIDEYPAADLWKNYINAFNSQFTTDEILIIMQHLRATAWSGGSDRINEAKKNLYALAVRPRISELNVIQVQELALSGLFNPSDKKYFLLEYVDHCLRSSGLSSADFKRIRNVMPQDEESLNQLNQRWSQIQKK